ncbi:hypothetical protein T4E_9284, partial [Trichinella pseudospiralis]
LHCDFAQLSHSVFSTGLCVCATVDHLRSSDTTSGCSQFGVYGSSEVQPGFYQLLWKG